MPTIEQSVGPVTPQQAFKSREGRLFLDVRTPSEYEALHIEGSLLRPFGELDPAEIEQLATSKESCLLICAGGTRARQAAERLKEFNLPPLIVMEGGIQAWEKAGLPLVYGQKMMSLERQVRITAGSLVFLGAVLGYFVNPYFIALSGFVGAGLVFAGITDTCGMGLLLARMPWNNRKSPAPGHSCTIKNNS